MAGNYKIGVKAWRRLYDTRDPEKYILTRTKSNAKIRGIECTITKEDIIIPEYCPILDIKLEEVRSGKPGAPSLDRKDNTKGYIKGNVFVISNKANTHKADMSVEDIRRMYEYVSS